MSFLLQRQIEKGNDLLEEVSTLGQEPTCSRPKDENSSEVVEDRGGVQELATSLRQHLGSFSEKLEGTRERIEDTAKCYQLMDRVSKIKLLSQNRIFLCQSNISI